MKFQSIPLGDENLPEDFQTPQKCPIGHIVPLKIPRVPL